MESIGTVLHAAVTAPVASGPRERTYGSSVPKPSSAGEADGQSSAILRLVLGAVEQFRTASELGRGAEEAATTTGFDIGRKHAPGTEVARGLNLYA
ncbi:MAG: hypothetical protein ABIG44_19670 [Planctomycetota bacterium]